MQPLIVSEAKRASLDSGHLLAMKGHDKIYIFNQLVRNFFDFALRIQQNWPMSILPTPQCRDRQANSPDDPWSR